MQYNLIMEVKHLLVLQMIKLCMCLQLKNTVINYARNCGETTPKKGIGCDDHWCIRKTDETDNIDGCVGLIDTYYGMYESGYIERFYK